MDLAQLNQNLSTYDKDFYAKLEPVLSEIAGKSKALASNLKECIDRLSKSDRYLRAYRGEVVAIKEAELTGEEFEIFRKYVRLLRSCTIMCNQDCSKRFKELFLDFFSGKRLQLTYELSKDQKEKTS